MWAAAAMDVETRSAPRARSRCAALRGKTERGADKARGMRLVGVRLVVGNRACTHAFLYCPLTGPRRQRGCDLRKWTTRLASWRWL